MIIGTKVTLRTVREADLDTLYTLRSDIRNRGRYYSLRMQSETALKKEFHETGLWTDVEGLLLICDKGEKIVGMIIADKDHYNGIDIGYVLFDEGSRNKGYVTEAVSLLVKYLFSTRKLNRISISIQSPNLASKRVAEKCGFKFEGIARGAYFHNGAYQDIEVYSILRDEVALFSE